MSALTRDLARFVAALRPADVPREALPWIRTAFTDCVGTLIAGRNTQEARILRNVLQPQAGECRLLFDAGTARAPDAAWINATAAHALDFDDAAQKGHVSTVLVPAILAEAEVTGADGRAMATAYAAGYETWAELLRRERDLHHNHSWHPTGVYGPLAVAAACASLLKLDEERTAHALAIAASETGGLIANFGTMVKPFHAGRASHAGLVAARLAQQGYAGALDALEHPKGLLLGISPKGNVDTTSPSEAGRAWKLPDAGINTKKYPVCFASHRALDGALTILAAHPLRADEIERVTVVTSRRNKGTLRYEQPADALQAKFSMHFSMAAAVLVRRCSLLELSDAFVARDDVQRLMRRVDVQPEDREDPARPGEAPLDTVTIETVDGRRYLQEVDYVRGGLERPFAQGELYAKFESCLAYGEFTAPARPVYDALMAIDSAASASAIYASAGAR